jgi:uncharacterized HhH-GPD family protein
VAKPAPALLYDRDVVDSLPFTDSAAANDMLARDPLALLVGFALDQQVTVQKAFSGPLLGRDLRHECPLEISERLGTFDARTLASTDLEPVFRARPAIHRFPGAMARRVRDLAAFIAERYDGDAARVWAEARTSEELRANLEALPGFGPMKVASLAAVLANRFDVETARPLIPSHPTLGDVDSAEALAAYQAGKRAHKAAMRAARTA